MRKFLAFAAIVLSAYAFARAYVSRIDFGAAFNDALRG